MLAFLLACSNAPQQGVSPMDYNRLIFLLTALPAAYWGYRSPQYLPGPRPRTQPGPAALTASLP